jgi:hypothetical protein
MGYVLFISGLARSGKTSTIDYLKSQGIPCLSTSVLLHQTYQNLISTGLLAPNHYWKESNKPQLRKTLITLAEEVIVPVFGRESFAQTVIRQANEYPLPLVAVETIGGEEFKLGLETLEKPYFCWNIRREGELKGVDIRELLEEGEDIWNDGSIEDLHLKIQQELDRRRTLTYPVYQKRLSLVNR